MTSISGKDRDPVGSGDFWPAGSLSVCSLLSWLLIKFKKWHVFPQNPSEIISLLSYIIKSIKNTTIFISSEGRIRSLFWEGAPDPYPVNKFRIFTTYKRSNGYSYSKTAFWWVVVSLYLDVWFSPFWSDSCYSILTVPCAGLAKSIFYVFGLFFFREISLMWILNFLVQYSNLVIFF